MALNEISDNAEHGSSTDLAETEMTISRLKSLWLCEAIRNKEGTGAIDDSEVVRLLASDPGLRHADDEQLIRKWAELLVQTNPVAKGLPRSIDFVISSGKYALIAMSMLALLMGVMTAISTLAARNTINIILVLIALLGPHVLSLTWSFLAISIGRRSARYSLTNAWIHLSKRFGRQHDGVFLVESLGTLAGRRVSLPWLLMGVSHFLWLLFALGCFVTSLVFLAFNEYEFVWRTSILPKEFFVRFVEIIGWLPGLLGFGSPTSDEVLTRINIDETRRAWSGWLLGGLATYGLIPRAILATVSYFTVKRSLDMLSIEVLHPYYISTLYRIRHQFPLEPIIIDPDPGNVGPTAPYPSTPEPHVKGRKGILVPFELQDDIPHLANEVVNDVVTLDNILSHDAITSALIKIQAERFARAAFVCDARTSADRSAFHFLRTLMEACDEVRVVLLHQDDARASKVTNWIAGIEEMGFSSSNVFPSLEPSIAWLQKG